MDELEAFVDGIDRHIDATVYTVGSRTLLFTAVAFVLSVVLVILCGRAGLFRRHFTIWTVLAGFVYYVYLPLVLTALGGGLSFVRALHNAADEWIDSSTRPIVAYASAYLPRFQRFVNDALDADPGSNLTLETMVRRFTDTEGSNRLAHAALFELNFAIVTHALPGYAAQGLRTVRRTDITAIDPSVLNILPNSLHTVAAAYFWPQYVLVIVMSLPFLGLAVAEYVVFLVFRHVWSRRRPPAVATT